MSKPNSSPALELARIVTPAVEFPITICVLFYGAFPKMCRRFLERLYYYTDTDLFHLRVGLNEVSDATDQLVHSYAKQHTNISVFNEPKNVFKNPLMRRMFHEEPITTRWTLWFDDDSYPFQGDWLSALALRIQTQPEIAFWGRRLKTSASPEAVEFIQSAAWFRDRPLVYEHINGKEKDRPTLFFLEGAYWAGRTEALYQLDWPDPRLIQNEEDYLFGEALRQNSMDIGECHSGVVLNHGARRGPGDTPSSYDSL